MSETSTLTAGDYIGHHLTHLQSKPMGGVIDFSVVNLDSVFWSVLLGLIGSFFPVACRAYCDFRRAGPFPGRGRNTV